MFSAKSHLHFYEQDGIHADDMVESRNIVQYISDQYKEFARWEDKFFEERFTVTGGRTIKQSAVLNDEQQKICEELRELRDCYIQTKGRA